MNKNYHDGIPERAFLIHPRDPATVIRVEAGEPGYHVEVRLHDPENAKTLVDTLNGGHLDDAVAEACLCGSMFGWRVPGASLEAYRKKE
jgi:hypothetical protein